MTRCGRPLPVASNWYASVWASTSLRKGSRPLPSPNICAPSAYATSRATTLPSPAGSRFPCHRDKGATGALEGRLQAAAQQFAVFLGRGDARVGLVAVVGQRALDDVVEHCLGHAHGGQARGQAHGMRHALQALFFLHRLGTCVEADHGGNMALSVPWCRRGFTPPRLWL